ncbi:proline iminopeptidase-family hydrolase [Fulvivirga sedimenti]|uniref:Proline iminopeptidase-family hydrolase n=1 Tax=Fulvivirga sedimenti TaxID=2879465 RepID=A0A9X1L081_9BACT|nr:proline iminopeptidase-family hydrolase [Fulvivirga sedimenti]MCA6079220.1 proline iminopeptidase-family hydrolase [Fulvivirga sedimenti]
MRYFILFLVLSTACTSADIQTKEGFFTSNGSEIYYRITGEGEPLIVVHGGPVLDHSYLLPWMDELARDYTVIYYDQRACGRSSVEVDTSRMTMEYFVDDIDNLRKYLNLEQVHLLGHSWGGLLAMQYAIAYPDHLKSMVLSSPVPPNNMEWQKEQMVLSEMIQPEDSLRRSVIMQSGELQTNPQDAITRLMKLSFKPQFYDTTALSELQLNIPADFMKRSQAFSYLAPDLASFNLYPQLAKLQLPVLIIFGSAEPGAEISGERMESVIPGSRLSIVPESGHFPFVENGEVYFKTIRKYLEGHHSY